MTERVLKMPRLGETMEEGRIAGWLVKPGEPFRRGDAILEIETDKTVAEYPALGNGVLAEILAAAGETVDVGRPIARVDIGGEPDWTGDEETAATPTATGSASPITPAIAAYSGLIDTDLLMPRLGETMEEGRIVRWLKAAGDAFRRGDAILEIETDKTVAEFPALGDGRLIGILRKEGELVPVGEPIARIIAPGEAAALQQAAGRPKEQQEAEATSRISLAAPAAAAGGRVRATPLARRLARSHGLDIVAIPGSGRRGRVEKADVLAAAKAEAGVPAAGDVRFAALKRGRLAYLDNGGGGEPVLLLHGFAGDRTTWAAVQSGLKRAGRRVIVPDLPGHGLTAIEADTVADLGADMGDLLDHLGIAQACVVAHSLGAAASLALATDCPNRVSALTLIAPAGLGSQIDTEFVEGMAWATAPGEVSHLLRRLSVQPVELSSPALAQLASELSRGRLRRLAEAVVGRAGQRVDTLGAINELTGSLPLKVVFGLEDRIIPWQQVTALPPTVAIHLLARSGHMPQWDQARDVVDIVVNQGGRLG